MTNSMPRRGRAKIAVIGGGITGMGAAYALSKHHDVTLFEAEKRLGGHAHTVYAGKSGTQPVDMGFIVFNYTNYPLMTALFDELNVPVVESNMSFGASVRGGRLEYALTSLDAVFAQRLNALDPRYLRMVRDIFRFNARGLETARGSNYTIKEFLNVLGTGDWFRDYYILPLSGAIWSTPTQKILDFPAATMMRFFENHALLSHSGQHQWYTVDGGSIEYVSRLQNRLNQQHVSIRLNSPIQSVVREDGFVHVKAHGGSVDVFDEVVFATHSDDTLKLLSDPRALEAQLLRDVKYQPNSIVLHCDETVMPKSRKCWSSWNYTEETSKKSDKIDLTYWMNSLQPIPKSDPLFVTLNGTRPIDEAKIYEERVFRHPVYDARALSAQKAILDINGENQTWFCGAWMKNGFHEDGLSSALDVVQQIDFKYATAVAAE